MPIKVKRNGAWVEVYGGAGGANNADWNQADENASDYIKNRTHYSTNIISNVKVATQGSTPFDNSSHSLYNQGYHYRCVLLSGNGDLIYRQPCAVSLVCPELNLFETTMAFVDGFYRGEVGHGTYFSYKVAIEQNPSSGLDLVMYSNYSVNPAEFFISVSSIYQISEKYIPDTIARVEDLSQIQGGIVVTDKNSDGNIVISNLLSTSTYAENLSF